MTSFSLSRRKGYVLTSKIPITILLSLGVVIFSYAQVGNMRPFGTSALLASLYMGIGAWGSIAFAFGQILANPTTSALITALVQSSIVFVSSVVKIKKRFNKIAVVIMCMTAYTLSTYVQYSLLLAFVGGTLAIACLYVCILFYSYCRAGKFRGSLLTQEGAAFGGILAVLGMGIMAMSPYLAISLGVLAILAASGVSHYLTFYIALSLGIGTAIHSLDYVVMSLLGILSLCVAVTGAHRTIRALVAVSVILFFSLYFDTPPIYTVLYSGIAVAVFLAVPNRYILWLQYYFDQEGGKLAVAYTVNQARDITARQLIDTSHMISQIGLVIGELQREVNNDKISVEASIQLLNGISQAMHNTVYKLQRPLGIDYAKETRVVLGLAKYGILASTVIKLGEAPLKLALSVRTSTAVSPIHIAAAVKKVLSIDVMTTHIDSDSIPGWSVLFLTQLSPYIVDFGCSYIAKEGISGDAHRACPVGEDAFAVILCDGMGSGWIAKRVSSAATTLVESFFRAGFDNTKAYESINKFLISDNERYVTLDSVHINIFSGVASITKLGSPASFVKKKHWTEAVHGSSLPLGMVDNIRPTVAEQQLHAGDMVVLVTDGVSDCYDTQDLCSLIDSCRGMTSQQVAELIINDTCNRQSNKRDDMSVAVMQLNLRV